MALIKKILVVFLSILTLGYSGGITIAKHYCKAELIDVALNSEVQKCKGAEVSKSDVPQDGISEKSCCTDVIASFQTNSFQKSAIEALSVGAAILIQPIRALVPVVKTPVITSVSLKAPPLSKRAIHVLFERFLI